MDKEKIIANLDRHIQQQAEGTLLSACAESFIVEGGSPEQAYQRYSLGGNDIGWHDTFKAFVRREAQNHNERQ